MSRTMFVNPGFSNPRRRKAKKRKSKSRGRRRARRGQRYAVAVRRNAGITPFVQNPLILSNPRRRTRRRRRNPLELPSVKGLLEGVLSYGGGAGLALTVNTLGTSRIAHDWTRRGVQVAVAALGGAMLSKKSATLGAAFAGAAMMAPIQDVAADVLGLGVGAGVAAAKEADLDALAADLEDVLDEMDDSELGDDDDDEMYDW